MLAGGCKFYWPPLTRPGRKSIFSGNLLSVGRASRTKKASGNAGFARNPGIGNLNRFRGNATDSPIKYPPSSIQPLHVNLSFPSLRISKKLRNLSVMEEEDGDCWLLIVSKSEEAGWVLIHEKYSRFVLIIIA